MVYLAGLAHKDSHAKNDHLSGGGFDPGIYCSLQCHVLSFDNFNRRFDIEEAHVAQEACYHWPNNGAYIIVRGIYKPPILQSDRDKRVYSI